ncbi:thioredoxin-like protein [Sparassis crispa]|uniref:Thioredoxin-like protein n=1 Tax=Sparassis crispa TaxID=139825 RepID=A0A401GKR9_9APHY|nr:thioredoxin-like protein [Sparassis crispa]GBE82765.1 thioredoxin-like protein [Sparassis crispa]
MSVNPNEDTEFNDILRKHGILPPREPEKRAPSPPPPPTTREKIEGLTAKELKQFGENAGDDETERMVETLRRQRLSELRRYQKAPYGRVYPIGRDDYTREVTEASKVNDDGSPEGEGNGTGVVCFLYKDGILRSDSAVQHVRILAQRHPHTKFVSIVGDKCIANLPDARIPMFIIYRNGDVLNQIVAWGGDRERKIEELEAVLILGGAITPEQQQGLRSERSRDSNSDDDEPDDEDSGDSLSDRMRSAATMTNVHSGKNIRRTQREEDSDSEFEFDL